MCINTNEGKHPHCSILFYCVHCLYGLIECGSEYDVFHWMKRRRLTRASVHVVATQLPAPECCCNEMLLGYLVTLMEMALRALFLHVYCFGAPLPEVVAQLSAESLDCVMREAAVYVARQERASETCRGRRHRRSMVSKKSRHVHHLLRQHLLTQPASPLPHTLHAPFPPRQPGYPVFREVTAKPRARTLRGQLYTKDASDGDISLFSAICLHMEPCEIGVLWLHLHAKWVVPHGIVGHWFYMTFLPTLVLYRCTSQHDLMRLLQHSMLPRPATTPSSRSQAMSQFTLEVFAENAYRR